MWPFGTPSARRQDIRRSRVERQPAWHRRLARLIAPWPAALSLLCAAVSSLILSIGGDELDLRSGQTLRHGLTARVAFTLEDAQKTNELKIRERLASPDYYVLDAAALSELRVRLQNVLALARAHAADPTGLQAEAAKTGLLLDDAQARELKRQADLGGAEFDHMSETVLRRVLALPLVNRPETDRRRNPLRSVLVDAEGGERSVDLRELVYVNSDAVSDALDRVVSVVREPLRGVLRGVLGQWLSGTPESGPRVLYAFDAARTLSAAEAAAEAVPRQSLNYPEGALLVDAGVVEPRELELLRAEHAAFVLTDLHSAARRWESLSRVAMVFLVCAGLTVFLSRPQARTGVQRSAQLITAGLLLLALLLARVSYVQGSETFVAVGAAAFAAALLAIVTAQRAALAICAAFALLTALATRAELGFFLILMSASGVLVAGLRDIRYRGKTVGVGALAGLAAMTMTIAIGLIDRQAPLFVVRDGLWAAAMTLAAAFIIEGILPGLERVLGISTSMTLLEWCDANKPLLRLMAADAPGTYNHSLLVGSLAEAGADAIGANGLLARSGAYYHDIGKINKPEYFVENQTPGASRHERLSPAMSLLIIVGHVKDGIEMAREYKLPAVLHRFIAEHHGTTLVEYFYHAATKQRKPGEAAPSDSAFRYPGPKPQTRESAIVMICDGVEGAVRALAEPTPGRISAVVDEIIRKRLIDGQFDECELTFRELATIERAVVKLLNSVYHARIVYPESPEEPRSGTNLGRAS